MERKRILVAFGDVRGFRKWILRANNSPENVGELMDAVYGHFEELAQRTACYMKYMGDGFLIVRELREGHNCGVARQLLSEMEKMSANVVASMNKFYPRPSGFRVRVASGYVWRRDTVKFFRGRLMRHPEYIGYCINMAQALLYAHPETECVCHESILEIIGPKKTGLEFKRLDVPKDRRHGIDTQDFAGLWSFRSIPKNKASRKEGN